MLDQAFDEIATKLLTELSWLSNAYGDTQKLEEVYEGRKRTYPAIRSGQQEFLKLMPDSHLGNFSFCQALSGDVVEWNKKLVPWVTTEFSVVFWFDFRDIFPGTDTNKTLNNVKDLILTAFRTMSLSKSIMEIDKIYDVMVDVYDEYTFVYSDPDWIGTERIAMESGNLFYLRPYGCLRFEGTVRYLQNDGAYTC